MDDRILRELYFSFEKFSEKLKPNEEYERLFQEAGGYYDKLFGILGAEPNKWLDEVFILEGEMKAEWGFTNFQAGVKFGLRLAACAFADASADLNETE